MPKHSNSPTESKTTICQQIDAKIKTFFAKKIEPLFNGLKKCPFCGKLGADIRNYAYNGGHDAGCWKCKYRLPVVKTREEAKALWNTRTK